MTDTTDTKASHFLFARDRGEHEVLDYRPEAQTWGHALHANTFRAEPTFLDRWLWRKCSRYSVMIHCRVNPRVGDTIIYRSREGEVRGTLTKVEPCGNPEDMFTVQFRKKASS